MAEGTCLIFRKMFYHHFTVMTTAMCVIIYSLQNSFKFVIAFVSGSHKEVGLERSLCMRGRENGTQTQRL